MPSHKGSVSPTAGTHSTGRRSPFYRYTVWRNKDDSTICAYATADEAAHALGMTRESFYCLLWRLEHGVSTKYTVMTEYNNDSGELPPRVFRGGDGL